MPLDKREGVVKRHFFAMVVSTAGVFSRHLTSLLEIGEIGDSSGGDIVAETDVSDDVTGNSLWIGLEPAYSWACSARPG